MQFSLSPPDRAVQRRTTQTGSCELPELAAEDVERLFRSTVLDALEVLADAKKLGPIPEAGEGGDLVGVSLRPLV